MRENRLLDIWGAGATALNCWLAIGSPLQAEMIASQGFDSVVVDCQHGGVDYHEMVQMFAALSPTDTVPLVRVAWNEPASIMRALDAGAYGVMAPMINTRAEAERFVNWCRYPPLGERSFGPLRASTHARTTIADYVEHANTTVLTIAQIESASALENLDEILSTPGLDAVYVGSADLSFSLGGPAAIEFVSPESVERHQRIVEGGRRHGVKVGLHAISLEDVTRCADLGADMITVASDVAEMTAGTAHRLQRSRQVLTGADGASVPVHGYGVTDA